MIQNKKVLDVCCGPKGMWFDKNDSRALYLDKRKEQHKNNYPSGEKTLNISPKPPSPVKIMSKSPSESKSMKSRVLS